MPSVGTRVGTLDGERRCACACGLVEVVHVFILEEVPAGERDDPVDDRELADPVSGRRRDGVDEDHSAHAVGARIGDTPCDVATSAVSDDHDIAVDLIDCGDRGVDPVRDADIGGGGRGLAEPWHGEGVHAMPCPFESGDHVVPARGVEPESGDEDDVHEPTLAAATDIHQVSATGAAR